MKCDGCGNTIRGEEYCTWDYDGTVDESGNDGTWMCTSVPTKYFKRTVIVQIGKGK